MMRKSATILGVLCVLGLAVGVQAEVVMDWVPIGDPGNVGELSGEGAGGFGPDRICGAVDYEYYIARHEVTNGQYIEFLNAVAGDDPYGLWTWDMMGYFGGIDRYGEAGGYTYGPKYGDAAWLDRPVNMVSFYDSLRFGNWLHNGQPTGPQGPETTEDGAYTFAGPESVGPRNPDAQVFLPTEDEWYKAAYYKGGSTDAGYWDYATGSDEVPLSEPPPGGENSANYSWAVGEPYYTSEVGAYALSDSAYGTFDQTGNLSEWTETLTTDEWRAVRGGSWMESVFPASGRSRSPAYNEPPTIGFRVAYIPEPNTLALLALGCTFILGRRDIGVRQHR